MLLFYDFSIVVLANSFQFLSTASESSSFMANEHFWSCFGLPRGVKMSKTVEKRLLQSGLQWVSRLYWEEDLRFEIRELCFFSMPKSSIHLYLFYCLLRPILCPSIDGILLIDTENGWRISESPYFERFISPTLTILSHSAAALQLSSSWVQTGNPPSLSPFQVLTRRIFFTLLKTMQNPRFPLHIHKFPPATYWIGHFLPCNFILSPI